MQALTSARRRVPFAPEARALVVGPLSDGRLSGHTDLDGRLSRQQPRRSPIADLFAPRSACLRLASCTPARPDTCSANQRCGTVLQSVFGPIHAAIDERVAACLGCRGGRSTGSSTITCTASISAQTRMSRATCCMIWRARSRLSLMLGWSVIEATFRPISHPPVPGCRDLTGHAPRA